ncbi:MAG: DNA primase [bacterium]|nr:DNA primase [bacterium]
MAKVYPPTTKYVIKIKFEVEGDVDEPDIIGAIFGQLEGLFGDELDLRELQRAGKIGRLLVEIESKIGGTTTGTIEIPSSLDRLDTAIIAASIEAVDRVGPYKAKFVVVDITDIRDIKRERILQRAKELLEQMKERVPESSEIREKIKEELTQAELIYIGEERLPAGPDVLKPDVNTIILVEGRADVLNLLKHGIKNVVAVGGVKGDIPKTIQELAKRKITIVFADGDKGGELFIKHLLEKVDVDYITRAPEGKEVEELTFKEIIRCLQRKQHVKKEDLEELITSLAKESGSREILKNKLLGKGRIFLLNSELQIEKALDSLEQLKDIKRGEYFALAADVQLTQKDIVEIYKKEIKLVLVTKPVDAIFVPYPLIIERL